MKIALALSLLLLAGCATAPPPPPRVNLDAEIIARGDEFLRRWAAKDVDGIVAMFTDDAQLTPPESQTITGRAAIRKQFAATIAMNTQNRVTRESIRMNGDQATERGRYEIRLGAFAFRGAYTIDWRRVDSVWMIAKYVAE